MLFAFEEFLIPDGTGSAVVVVAGNDEDGHAERADRGAGGGNGGAVGLGRVEEVAGDEDEDGVGAADDVAESADGVEALLADAVAFCLVADGGEWLAELPVRGVKEGEGHEVLTGCWIVRRWGMRGNAEYGGGWVFPHVSIHVVFRRKAKGFA